MKQKNNLRTGAVIGIILLAALSRLAIPPILGSPSNFAPIGAMALFGGACFGRSWLAFVIPLMALWLSDWFVNLAYTGEFNPFYPGFYWQYIAFACVVLLGSVMLKKVKPMRLIGASLLASVIFFVVSNFGVWIGGTMYPMTLSGFYTCLVAAIPFFQGTLYGDLIYSVIIFGAFALAQWRFPSLASNQPALAA